MRARVRDPELNRQYQRKWYAANKAVQRIRVKANTVKHLARNRNLIWDYLLSHPCVDCEEDNPIVLQFDHRDPKQKLFAIGRSLSNVGQKKLLAEIAKCDVRCANCHIKRTNKQFNFWRSNRDVV
jgi:hypothetical protein